MPAARRPRRRQGRRCSGARRAPAARPGSRSSETAPWPLPWSRKFADRRATEGSEISGPAIAPIWIQFSSRSRSGRSLRSAGMHLGRRLAPEVVEHQVDLGGGLADRLRRLAERRPPARRPRRRRGRGARESRGIAAGADDPPRAEMLGDLHGHLPALPVAPSTSTDCPGSSRDATAQRDPRGHRRVHRGRDDAARRRRRAGRCCGARSTAARSAIVPNAVSGATK